MLKSFLPPRRKGAKQNLQNAAALCVFAPWRENRSHREDPFVRS